MRLAALLAAATDEQLERLTVEHVRTDERLPRLQLCVFLEGAIRSYRFINDFVINRQPPSFALLTLLLDAPGNRLPTDGLGEAAMNEAHRINVLIGSHELLTRENQLQLYRRAFLEARRNDLDLNASEAAILTVLRREQDIAQVEHFLLEHHDDFREFWDRPDAANHEITALQSAGLVHQLQGDMLIPEDVAPAIRQALGLDMPTESARRLFSYFDNSELADVLARVGAKVSGSKEIRVERLLTERIQPRIALRSVGLSTLRDICREANASVSGNKDDVIERIVEHFAQNKDRIEPETPAPPVQEVRRLDRTHFEIMFGALTGQDLSDILRRFPELRQSGAKDTKIRTLWDAHLAESTLLGELMNRQLEDFLYKLNLRLGGSKAARIERLIEHFGKAELPAAGESTTTEVRPASTSPEIAEKQELFRQKASNPQGSLQPYLNELFEGGGLIKCYATDDENPTKQLKNKLSQAAAARDGLLVLLLGSEDAFARTKEALIERWMSNPEWPKSVAAVALGYPFGAPTIMAVIERAPGPWADMVRRHLFPAAVSYTALGAQSAPELHSCSKCNRELPSSAKFCPECGQPRSASVL